MVSNERRNSVDPIPATSGYNEGTSPYDHKQINAQNGRSKTTGGQEIPSALNSRVPNVINGYPSNPVPSSSSGGGLQIKDLYALGLTNGRITIPVRTNSEYRNVFTLCFALAQPIPV